MSASIALSGCGDGDDPAPLEALALPAPTPLPECPDANYATCDIREPACHARLMALAACLRQSEPIDVPVDVITEEAYGNILARDAADGEPESPYFARALAVLGLASPWPTSDGERIHEEVERTGGFYSSVQKRVTIIDHGRPADSSGVDAVLLHELVHALQDADYDLANLEVEPTFDAILARKTLIEGEASFYEYRAAVALLGLDIDEVDFDSALARLLERTVETALASDLTRSFSSVPYGLGASRAYAAWQQGGPPGINALWASPPGSMQQVMSELFGLNEPQGSRIAIPEPAVLGLELDSSDELGAWSLYELLASAGDPEPIARSLEWRGDHFWVYTGAPQGSPHALWQLVLESPEAASRWSTRFTRFGVEHRAAGNRLYVTYAVGGGAASPSLKSWGEAWLAE